MSALLSRGTRSVIDAVFDPVSVGELDQARALARSLRPGTLLLADRGYAAADLLATLAGTGADLLVRAKANRRVQRSNSKYRAHGPNIDRRSYKAATTINIISPDP